MAARKKSKSEEKRVASQKCEICHNTADRKCSTCNVAFYCCMEHQNVDFESIHGKICPILKELRNDIHCVTEETRKQHQQEQEILLKSLLEICLIESESYLSNQQHNLSIPCSLQALRAAKQLFGSKDEKLIPILLTLSRGCLGTSRHRQAQQFLSQCKLIMHYSFQNHNDNNNSNDESLPVVKDYLLLSQFHRLYGRLHAMEGRYEESLKQLSKDVYYSSLCGGPEHIRTAAGFYQISQVLLKQNKTQAAMQFYYKIIHIWLQFVKEIESSQKNNQSIDISQELGDSQIKECKIMLNTIIDTLKKFLGSQSVDTGKAFLTMALVCHLSNDLITANENYKEAYSIFTLHFGEKHENSKDVADRMQLIKASM